MAVDAKWRADAGAAEPVLPLLPVPLRRRSRYLVYSEGGLNGASAGAAGSASADGCQAAAGEAVSPVATPAPEPAPGVFPDGGLPGASAEAAAGASADGSAAGAGMPVSPLVSPAPEPAPGVSPDGGPSGVSSRGGGAHSPRFCPQRRHQSRAAAPHSCGCPAPRLATRRRTLLLSRSSHRAPLHLFPSAADRPPPAGRPGRRREPVQLCIFSALPITACATAMGRLCRRNAPCSASSALLARALDSARRRLAGGRGWAGHPSHLRAPSVHLRCRIIRPWPWSAIYEPPASGDRHHRQRSALQHR